MAVSPPSAYAAGTKLTVGSHDVEIVKFIGEGGFAHVYTVRVTPPVIGHELCCLKRVQVPNKAYLNLLRAEVDAMQRLRGASNVVQYFDSHAERMRGAAGAEGQYEVFVLMEFCAGGGLIDFMNRRLRDQLREVEILKIMYDVTLGLAHMHYLRPPLLHRDLKIENVLITADGTFKLCDFGSVSPVLRPPVSAQEYKILMDDINHQTTVQYRAPEMIRLSPSYPITEKADIWALGVFLYKLCFYTTPFERPNQTLEQFQQLILSGTFQIPARPAYSERLRNMIRVLLQNDPRLRPNVFQVMQEICQMRGVECPLEDIYSTPQVLPPPAARPQTLPLPPLTQPIQNTQLPVNSVGQIGQAISSQVSQVGNQPVGSQVGSQPVGQTLKPVSSQPISSQPISTQPVGQPLSSQPISTQPVGQPLSSQPISTQPVGQPLNPVGSQPVGQVGQPVGQPLSSQVGSQPVGPVAPSITPIGTPIGTAGLSRSLSQPSTTRPQPPSPLIAPDDVAARFPSLEELDNMPKRTRGDELHQILTGLDDKSSTVVMDPEGSLSSVDFLRVLRPGDRRHSAGLTRYDEFDSIGRDLYGSDSEEEDSEGSVKYGSVRRGHHLRHMVKPLLHRKSEKPAVRQSTKPKLSSGGSALQQQKQQLQKQKQKQQQPQQQQQHLQHLQQPPQSPQPQQQQPQQQPHQTQQSDGSTDIPSVSSTGLSSSPSAKVIGKPPGKPPAHTKPGFRARPRSAVFEHDLIDHGEEISRRGSIQQRVHHFLNSHDRQHPPVRTARGYGRFTDSDADARSDSEFDFSTGERLSGQ